MTEAFELIRTIEEQGGHIRVEDGFLVISPEEAALSVLDRLREYKVEIIDLLTRRPFVAWFDSRVWLDAEAVALRRPDPRWSTGVNALYADFCAWMFAQDLAPVTREQFRNLLAELCCEIRPLNGEEFVSNLALKEDVEAQRNFEKEVL